MPSCKQTHPCSWRRQGVVWICVEANGWASPSRISWFCPVHLEATNDLDLHDDDDMSDIPPCGHQDLFCK